MGAWEQEIKSLEDGGFTNTEIANYRSQREQELVQSGFTMGEVNKYFGIPEFDPSGSQEIISTNIERLKEVDPETQKPKMKQASTFLEALEAGWDMSVSGLLVSAPDTELPADAGMFTRLSSQVAQLAGDVPAMAIGGAITGGPSAGVMTAVGAFALPSGMRKVLMDHYEKGDVKDFSDFWERTSGALWETIKGGVTGGATAFAGGKVGGMFMKEAAGAMSLTGKSASIAAEVATMVTVGHALEGQAPKPTDFLEAAILVAGMHAVKPVSSKLRQVYTRTGARPTEVVLEARKNPILQQELLAENPNMERISDIIGQRPSLDAPKDIQTEFGTVREGTGIGKLAEERGSVSGEKTPEPPKFERTEAELEALKKIGVQPDKPSALYTAIAEATDLKEMYRNRVDKLDPISFDKEAYEQARMAPKYLGKAIHAIEFGTFDFETGKVNGKGLKEIVSQTKDKVGLDAYLFAATEAERGRQTNQKGELKKTRIPLETADKVVSEGKSRFGKIAKEVTAWGNKNLEYLAESGVISKDFLESAKALHENYAPLKKILDAEIIDGKKPGKAGFLKASKGGEGDIQSPLQSFKENTETIYRLAEKNRARLTFVDNVFKDKDQTLLTKVKQATTLIEVSPEEVNTWLKKNGVEADLSEAEALKIYRRAHQPPLAKNQFEVWRDGKREVYEADVPVAEALKSLDGNAPAQGLLMILAQTVTSTLKLGTTMLPDFTAKNMIRDQVQSGVFTKGNVTPFVDVWTAMGHILKKDSVYQDYMKSGASGGQFIDFNAEYFQKDILQMQKETAFLDAAHNVVKKPLDLLKFGNYLIETAPRVAEYKRTGDPMAASEITLDFTRHGAKMAGFNSITAFANVGIQALDKTTRAFKNDPVGISARGFAYITVPSMFLWYANRDEDWYKRLPRWEKDLFWHVKAGNSIIRVPKPGELGVMFGTLPERILEKTFTENPRALKDFDETIVSLLMPNILPDLARAPLEHWANKSFFTGSPIVSWNNEKYVAAEQYSEYTSETAKQIGKLVAAVDHQVHKIGLPSVGDIGSKDVKIGSPQVIDHYIRALTGQGGAYLSWLIDQALYKSGAVKDYNPSMKLADVPFVKAFVSRYPRANAQPITDFQERYTESKKNLETFKMLTKTGRGSEAISFFQKHQEEMLTLEKTKQLLSQQSTNIKKIYWTNMSANDKRQLIDGMYLKMIQSAEYGLSILDKLDKARNKK